jgi:hypothetical protein
MNDRSPIYRYPTDRLEKGDTYDTVFKHLLTTTMWKPVNLEYRERVYA